MIRILDWLRVAPQFILPRHRLTAIVHLLARCRLNSVKNSFIRVFIAMFRVDMSLSEHRSPDDYEHFNAFFTRSIRKELRPLPGDADAICSPVDGTVSQSGLIDAGDIFQAKNRFYSLDKLLANDTELVPCFSNGCFMTLYLSPGDYHRVHMPCNGRLQCMTYVPGDLFAVNAHTVRVVKNLFTRNERVISLFDTDRGPMALIMIGAIFVGSMETVWDGVITPASRREMKTTDYPEKPFLQRGEEMGRFNMGSTVILLFPENTVQWQDNNPAGKRVIMGETIGRFIK